MTNSTLERPLIQSGLPEWDPPMPPPPQRPTPRRLGRAWLRIVAVVVLAGTAGGAAGWVAGHSGTGTGTQAATTFQPSEMLAGDSLDVAGVLAVAGPSITSVHTTMQYRDGPFVREGEGAGTAVVLTSEGLVLTNAHVVEDALTINVSFPDDTTAYVAELVAIDSDADIAVLRVDGVSGLTPAGFADSDQVKVGDDVVAIGNALDLGDTMTVTRGIISALDRTIETESGNFGGLIQTDAAISSGNSGGALIDVTGAVIGMNSAGAADSSGVSAENIGFAIPSNTILAMLEALGIDVG